MATDMAREVLFGMMAELFCDEKRDYASRWIIKNLVRKIDYMLGGHTAVLTVFDPYPSVLLSIGNTARMPNSNLLIQEVSEELYHRILLSDVEDRTFTRQEMLELLLEIDRIMEL